MSLAVRVRQDLAGLDPRKLPGLVAWYDAQYPTGFGAALPANGAVLAQWNDLSGNNRHLVQATSTLRPLWWQTPNGLIPSMTQLVGGGTIDTNGVYTCGATAGANGAYFWIHIPGGNGASVRFGADWFATTQSPSVSLQPDGGRYYGAQYFAADQTTPVFNTDSPTPHTSNGSAASYPLNTWTRANTHFAIGPGIYWVKFAVGSSTYCASGTQFKNMDIWIDGPSSRAYVSPTGGPTVQFDGVDDYLATAASIGVNGGAACPVTAYTVAVYSGLNGAAGNSQRWISCTANGNSFSGGVGFSVFPNNNNMAAYCNSSGGAQKNLLPINTPVVAEGRFDGVNAAEASFSGKSFQLASAAGASGLSLKLYMSASNSANQVLFGSIQAAVVFSVKHDEATRRRVEQWLGARYGVTLTRP